MTIGTPDRAFEKIFHMDTPQPEADQTKQTIAQILALISRQARLIVKERDRTSHDQPTNHHPHQDRDHSNLNAQLDALADTSRRICEHFAIDHLTLADEINRAHTSRTIPTQPLLEESTRRRNLALDAAARAQHGKGARTPTVTLADAYDLQASTLKDIIHWILETEGAANAQA